MQGVFSSRTERKEQRRSVKKKNDKDDGKKNGSVGPSKRENENLPTVPLSESTLQFAAKMKKKEQRKLPEKKIERRRRKEMSVCTPEEWETKVSLRPFKLPRLSFLTSSLSPSLQSKLINDDDEEEKEKRKKARK